MNKKGWLLYNKEDAKRNAVFIDRMLGEAQNLGLQLELKFMENFTFGVRKSSLIMLYESKEIEPADFVIMRAIDEDFSTHMEYMGIKVFNSSHVSRITNDKARTYQYLATENIPMVDMLFISQNQVPAIEEIPLPCVIKDVRGRGGTEVFKAASKRELEEILTRLKDKKIVIQKMGSPGRDVRVFVVGKEIVASVLRESKNDFRSNFSLGGTSQLYKLTSKEEQLVKKIISLFDFGMVGIDFIFDEKGDFLFNEIEDVVGSRTLSMNSDINIVQIYLQYIMTNIA